MNQNIYESEFTIYADYSRPSSRYDRVPLCKKKSSSKSSQSSSTTTKTNNAIVEDTAIQVTDGAIGARDNAVAVGNNSNVTIERLDAEIIDTSLSTVNDVVDTSIDAISDTVDSAFDFSGDVVGKFDGLSRATIEANSRTTDKVIAGLFNEAEQGRESEDVKTLQTLGIYLSIATGIVTLGKIFS